jgi:hypothetical protein
MPDPGAFFFVFVGANALAGAVKIGRLLVLGRVVISSGRTTSVPLGTEDALFFLGGVVAGAIVGMISIRDGLAKLVR